MSNVQSLHSLHSLHLGPWTLDSRAWTLDLGLWTLDFGLWTLDFGLWTLDFGLWTLDFGLWAWTSTGRLYWCLRWHRLRRGQRCWGSSRRCSCSRSSAGRHPRIWSLPGRCCTVGPHP